MHSRESPLGSNSRHPQRSPFLVPVDSANESFQIDEIRQIIEGDLLPNLVVRSIHPHDPVVVNRHPSPWTVLGCGNYAAVFAHPDHPNHVVKVYAPGRPGLQEEREVYRRIGVHQAYSVCHHASDAYLVLNRLEGVTLYDCLRHGIRIPPQVIKDVDEAIKYAIGRGLHGHDLHGRNILMHQGRGFIVDISDFLNPQPCRAWVDIRKAYYRLYLPFISPLNLRIPGWMLSVIRKCYRIYAKSGLFAHGKSTAATNSLGCSGITS